MYYISLQHRILFKHAYIQQNRDIQSLFIAT